MTTSYQTSPLYLPVLPHCQFPTEEHPPLLPFCGRRAGASPARPFGGHEILPQNYDTHEKDPSHRAVESLHGETDPDSGADLGSTVSGCLRRPGVDGEPLGGAPGDARVYGAATFCVDRDRVASVNRAGDSARAGVGEEKAGVTSVAPSRRGLRSGTLWLLPFSLESGFRAWNLRLRHNTNPTNLTTTFTNHLKAKPLLHPIRNNARKERNDHHKVRRYCPRIECLFMNSGTRNCHWLITTKIFNGILTRPHPIALIDIVKSVFCLHLDTLISNVIQPKKVVIPYRNQRCRRITLVNILYEICRHLRKQ